MKIGPSFKITAKMPGGDCQCFTKSKRFDDWSSMEQMAMDAQVKPERDFVLSSIQPTHFHSVFDCAGNLSLQYIPVL